MEATDRCDRCGAQAYTEWWKPGAVSSITLCAHHTAEHQIELIAAGWDMTIDDRSLLTGAPWPA